MSKSQQDMRQFLKFLQEYHTIAVVGFSANPYRPSHFVSAYMQDVGYNIIPINPHLAGQTLLGKRVYASLQEAKAAGEQIEIVDVFRRAEYTPAVAQEAIEIGAKVLWLQLGIRNDAAVEQAEKAGLIAVQDRCIKVDHAHYFG